jgi:hypothetical protein
MKKAAKKQPKPKPYVGPMWKSPSDVASGRKISPSRTNPKYSIEVSPDGSRTKWGPYEIKKGDSIITATGHQISPIKRPAPKPKPVKDTITSYTNHGPIGTFDRGKYIEKVKPISQNPNSKVNKTKTKATKPVSKKATTAPSKKTVDTKKPMMKSTKK